MEPDQHVKDTFSDTPHLLTILSVDDALYATLKFIAIANHDDSHSVITTMVSIMNDDHSLMLHDTSGPTANGVYFGNEQSMWSERKE